MANSKYKLTLFLVLTTLLISCSVEDVYHDLTDEARALIAYEMDDEFFLSNNQSGEILSLSIISKEIYYDKASKIGSPFATGADTFFETGIFRFQDVDDCYQGTAFIEALRNDSFRFSISLEGCFDYAPFPFFYENEILESFTLDGVSYEDVYILRTGSRALYYSKLEGILLVINEFTEEIEYSIAI